MPLIVVGSLFVVVSFALRKKIGYIVFMLGMAGLGFGLLAYIR